MMFKVGDKVRIVDLTKYCKKTSNCSSYISTCIAQEGVVIDVYDTALKVKLPHHVKRGSGYCNFTEVDLELVNSSRELI